MKTTLTRLDQKRVLPPTALLEVGAATTNGQLRQWSMERLQRGEKGYTFPANVITIETTVAGVIATLCHGAGVRHPTVADRVRRVEIVNAHGELQWISEPEQVRAAVCFGLAGILVTLVLELDEMTCAVFGPASLPMALAIPVPVPVRAPEAKRVVVPTPTTTTSTTTTTTTTTATNTTNTTNTNTTNTTTPTATRALIATATATPTSVPTPLALTASDAHCSCVDMTSTVNTADTASTTYTTNTPATTMTTWPHIPSQWFVHDGTTIPRFSAATEAQACQRFYQSCSESYYAEWFWFAFTDRCMVNTWNNNGRWQRVTYEYPTPFEAKFEEVTAYLMEVFRPVMTLLPDKWEAHLLGRLGLISAMLPTEVWSISHSSTGDGGGGVDAASVSGVATATPAATTATATAATTATATPATTAATDNTTTTTTTTTTASAPSAPTMTATTTALSTSTSTSDIGVQVAASPVITLTPTPTVQGEEQDEEQQPQREAGEGEEQVEMTPTPTPSPQPTSASATTVLAASTPLPCPAATVGGASACVTTPLCNALHFRRGIQNCRVKNVEVLIPIPWCSSTHSPDWSVCQRAWWDAIEVVYRYKAKRQFPLRTALEMRLVGPSQISVAPEFNNPHGTCSIEVVTFLDTDETLWQTFTQDLVNVWSTYEDETHRPLLLRCHWAKGWDHLSVGGQPYLDYYRRHFGSCIDDLRRGLAAIAARGGYPSEEAQRLFGNETLDRLMRHQD